VNVRDGRIAVVVPTIRDECWEEFLNAWSPIFRKHEVYLLKVRDGDQQHLQVLDHSESDCHPLDGQRISAPGVLDHNAHFIHRYTPACRNLGFAAVAAYFEDVSVIVTLDDDCLPVSYADDGDLLLGIQEKGEDTIEQHLTALDQSVPISWVNTMEAPAYPRGFPYGIRQEAPVMLSHGVWHNVPDWDAPTQLVKGDDAEYAGGFFRGVIPRGTYFPMCGMNVAFRRELLPYVYYAPVSSTPGCERFDDIWAGIHIKEACDRLDYGVVSGYAVAEHVRASNVFSSLRQEAVGLQVNETYWQNHGKAMLPAFAETYAEKRQRWESQIREFLHKDSPCFTRTKKKA